LTIQAIYGCTALHKGKDSLDFFTMFSLIRMISHL
jgi:hypothetical protein